MTLRFTVRPPLPDIHSISDTGLEHRVQCGKCFASLVQHGNKFYWNVEQDRWAIDCPKCGILNTFAKTTHQYGLPLEV